MRKTFITPKRCLSILSMTLLVGLFLALSFTSVLSHCSVEPVLQNYTGLGQVVCPCFVSGEQAGAIFTLPPEKYPIEILKIGIGWGSQFGGSLKDHS